MPSSRPARLALAFALPWLLWLPALTCHAVDLNTANQAELEQVKGVGPQLSGRLLAERRNGPFGDWADVIRRMRGVGPVSAAKLSAGGLTVAGQAYLPAATAAPAASAASAGSAASGATR
ncbi:MAG TPA: helix-hairpin-helix domain-containing protein [Ideonella sp.]|nr:helix-hairpin-helix domain-containing protein [Ideonella sp.]